MEHPAEESVVTDLVVGLFSSIFERVFATPFRQAISNTLKRKAVLRQVDEAADAASQSLTRLLLNEKLTEGQTTLLLEGLDPIVSTLHLEQLANPNISPEALVQSLLAEHPLPDPLVRADLEALSRVSLHAVVQVLTLVAPVMSEWQKLSFSTNFELPRRVVGRLNKISEQLDVLGKSGQDAADERYELTYRDYLMQRFHRVEAGTVKMTTSLDVDLRELFVMPRVLPRKRTDEQEEESTLELMDLRAARKRFQEDPPWGRIEKIERTEEPKGVSALDQVLYCPRNVMIGAPGGGKSTFVEWLQLRLASVEEELPMNGRQAIPLLLRVRQLDLLALPEGASLIAAATASTDRAKLMPPGWIERQMQSGHVLLMLDGLDETDPTLRDRHLLPWLQRLNSRYPKCRFLVSSRPSGYPVGTLRSLGFAECDLLDFEEPQIAEYTRHWCTAVRLARNEPEQEARDEGAKDGEQIVCGFRDNPYIQDLARNPLMLSAICLVNYFEGGTLPEDRALLYRLCVEGLLHHWDQRRGIHSEFGLEEKLRVSREVALAMQADDRAEYEAEKVARIFGAVLDDPGRGTNLLEHVRYRTGLLVERRPGVFAFTHLTFQEYLAAQAIHEGNRLGLGPERLVQENDDPQWQEVIALYCGISTDAAAIWLIRQLMNQPDTPSIGSVLGEAYRAAQARIGQDKELRTQVFERIANSPSSIGPSPLDHFPEDEVAPVANRCLGHQIAGDNLSNALMWLFSHGERFNTTQQLEKLEEWPRMDRMPLTELVFALHMFGEDKALLWMTEHEDLYFAPGPHYEHPVPLDYRCQGEIALLGLSNPRQRPFDPNLALKVLLPIFRAITELPVQATSIQMVGFKYSLFTDDKWQQLRPSTQTLDTILQLIPLVRKLRRKLKAQMKAQKYPHEYERVGPALKQLEHWIRLLETTAEKAKHHPDTPQEEPK